MTNLIGGGLVLLLPETIHTTLPDTLEQAVQIQKVKDVEEPTHRSRTQSLRSMTDRELLEESAQTDTFI